LLTQRIECQELSGCPDGGLRRHGPGLMWYEPGEDLNRGFAETRALGAEPLLECFLADFEAIQQIADVENGGLLEIPRSASSGKSFEVSHVDVDTRLIERHSIALDLEDAGLVGRQNASERAQALTKTLARLLLAGTAPEHRGQLAAHEALFRPHGKIGKQGLSFTRRKFQASIAGLGLKTSEESDAEADHRASVEGQATCCRLSKEPHQCVGEI